MVGIWHHHGTYIQPKRVYGKAKHVINILNIYLKSKAMEVTLTDSQIISFSTSAYTTAYLYNDSSKNNKKIEVTKGYNKEELKLILA